MKNGRVSLICAALLFLSASAFAIEPPEMREADISGTGLQHYYLSTTEVTQSMYQTVMGKNPSACVKENSVFSKLLAGESQEERPVESVTFFDAMLFCNRLTERFLGRDQCVYTLSDPVYDSEGRIIRFGKVEADFSRTGYRLPTREEWQNAAGTEPAAAAMYAWFTDNSAARGEGRTGYGTHAVAKKLPNECGLYDMYGNVAEMCHEGETLGLCIMGTAWNRIDEYYTDGYSVDYLYGYDQYTVARNHARESFAGFSTCGFRLCRSVSDLPFTLTSLSVPAICDTYDGIVPVSVSGSGFLCRRTEPVTVSIEGFVSGTAERVEWLTDSSAVIYVKAEPFKIQGSQESTLRVIFRNSTCEASVTGSITRIHTEFPVHPADVLLDDGTLIVYEDNHVFSVYEKEHAVGVVIYAPYDGTEITVLGLVAVKPDAENLDDYAERAGIFGAYLGSGWYLPEGDELAPLSDAAFAAQVTGLLDALDADLDIPRLPVKSVHTRGLITQKYEYLTANDLLREAAAKDAELAALAEREAAEQAAREAEEARLAAERAAREAAEAEERARKEAEEAALAEEQALAAQTPQQGEGETKRGRVSALAMGDEARTLIGFALDTLELTDSVQTVSAELSTGLVFPFLYLSAEGNFTLGIASNTFKVPIINYPVTYYTIPVPYWDIALSLGFSYRLQLGSFHPDLFVSAGAMTNADLWNKGPFVRARLEAGLDIPLFKKLVLTARYTADLRLGADTIVLVSDYRLMAGFSIAFPSFILF